MYSYAPSGPMAMPFPHWEEDTPQNQAMLQDLQNFVQHSSRRRMCYEDDVLQFYEQFLTLSNPLTITGYLSSDERDTAFWCGFHPDDRSRFLPYSPDTPPNFEDAFVSARTALSYKAPPIRVSPSPSPSSSLLTSDDIPIPFHPAVPLPRPRCPDVASPPSQRFKDPGERILRPHGFYARKTLPPPPMPSSPSRSPAPVLSSSPTPSPTPALPVHAPSLSRSQLLPMPAPLPVSSVRPLSPSCDLSPILLPLPQSPVHAISSPRSLLLLDLLSTPSPIPLPPTCPSSPHDSSLNPSPLPSCHVPPPTHSLSPHDFLFAPSQLLPLLAHATSLPPVLIPSLAPPSPSPNLALMTPCDVPSPLAFPPLPPPRPPDSRPAITVESQPPSLTPSCSLAFSSPPFDCMPTPSHKHLPPFPSPPASHSSFVPPLSPPPRPPDPTSASSAGPQPPPPCPPASSPTNAVATHHKGLSSRQPTQRQRFEHQNHRDPKHLRYHQRRHQFRYPLAPPHSHGLPHSSHWHLEQRRPGRPPSPFKASFSTMRVLSHPKTKKVDRGRSKFDPGAGVRTMSSPGS